MLASHQSKRRAPWAERWPRRSTSTTQMPWTQIQRRRKRLSRDTKSTRAGSTTLVSRGSRPRQTLSAPARWVGRRLALLAGFCVLISPRTSPQAVPEFQCLQRILLQRTSSKRAKATRRGVLGQRTKGTAMAMLWNITMPTRAPAAELASPQALPGFDFKRFRKPSVKPSLGLNVKREIHIDPEAQNSEHEYPDDLNERDWHDLIARAPGYPGSRRK